MSWIRCVAHAVVLVAASGVVAGADDGKEPAVAFNRSDWPPYFIVSDDPEAPPGLAVEISRMCLSENGFRWEERSYPLRRMLTELREGGLDFQLSQRDAVPFLLYGRETVFSPSYRLVVRAGSGIELARVSDLAGLTIGQLAGFELGYRGELAEVMAARATAGAVVTTPYEESLFNLLLAGRVDGFIFTEASARWRARELGVAHRVEVLDLELMVDHEVFAVSRASRVITDGRAFLDAMDGCLRRARADGRLRAIAERYEVDSAPGP